ncbi:Sensory/regulatory protein RpfC [Alphaproteobacteria bacterium SO-S41]|nr:Sensory/regulatory protein RpfC [Alphaproteobacteria bacterium SO-S41]
MARQRDPSLRERVATRRALLRARRSRAGDGERAKAAFLSVISHELRTPLNTILGQTDLLATDGLPPHVHDAIEAIRTAGEGLNALLSDVLELARLEAGAAAPERADLDIRNLAESVRRLCQPKAWAQNLDLEVAVDRAVPQRLRGDGGRIRQTLINLAGNALKFTERGGISISVEMQSQGARGLKISVSDTGIGIEPRDVKRIFASFEQSDRVLTRRHGGLGLGLALCNRLVESMDGTIGVESQPGQGSTFWFTVPVGIAETSEDHEAPAQAEGAPDASAIARINGLRVLAADDNPLHRAALARICAACGIELELVADGLEAVETAGRKTFDAVILDAHMPVVGGVQAGRMIRALHQRQANAAILIACPEGDHAEADGDGVADAVLYKPYSMSSIAAALAAAVSGETGDAAFDSSGVAELEQAVGRPVLVDILKSYLTNAAEMMALIEAAAPTGDTTVLEQAARDLAGAASGLGLAALTAAARELSQAARRGDEDDKLANHAAALAALTTTTHRQLAQLYPDVATVLAA